MGADLLEIVFLQWLDHCCGAWPRGMVEMVGAEQKAKGEMMKLGRRKLDILSLKKKKLRILNGKLYLNYDTDTECTEFA